MSYKGRIVILGTVAVVTAALLWWQGKASEPGRVLHTYSALGFSLELPREWQGSFKEEVQEQSVRFVATPKGEPEELMFFVQVAEPVAWELAAGEQGPHVRELDRLNGRVYYAGWSVGNPYTGRTGLVYFRMMQVVPEVLDSFKLQGANQSERPEAPSGNGFCIQVITPARNKATGEVKDFPTPCDVPEDWEPLPPELM